MTTYVAYARVSTAKQGKSGLGLEAQEEAIRAFLKPEDNLLAPTYVEVESGKRSDRPELEAALRHAKLTGATILVAKLDRLTRNVRFLLTLLAAGVEVAFCDLPHVKGPMGRFILTQMASVAELEAGLISERTKAALRAARERGVTLGGFRGVKVDQSLGLAERQHRASDFASRVYPEIERIMSSGTKSLREVAAELNSRGISTRRGGLWTASQVSRVITKAAVRVE